MPQRGAYGVRLDTCCMVEVDPERFEVMLSEALDGIPGDLGELMSNAPEIGLFRYALIRPVADRLPVTIRPFDS